ncbi:MAG: hypothetical protein IAE95_14295 [Chitinophagaceae bacterium]|nr:hypothetical protein [Chitinophagaceae bacterium]
MDAPTIINSWSPETLQRKMLQYRQLLEQEREGGGKLKLTHMVPYWTEGLRLITEAMNRKKATT